jgi:hypothetical protein
MAWNFCSSLTHRIFFRSKCFPHRSFCFFKQNEDLRQKSPGSLLGNHLHPMIGEGRGGVMTRERARKAFWVCLAALVALQIYFVRELLAAELLFAGVFGVLFLLWFVFFLADEIGRRFASWAQRQSVHVQAFGQVARREWIEAETGAAKFARALSGVTDMQSFVAAVTPAAADARVFARRQFIQLQKLATAAPGATLSAGRFARAQVRNFVATAPGKLASVRDFVRLQLARLQEFAKVLARVAVDLLDLARATAIDFWALTRRCWTQIVAFWDLCRRSWSQLEGLARKSLQREGSQAVR